MDYSGSIMAIGSLAAALRTAGAQRSHACGSCSSPSGLRRGQRRCGADYLTAVLLSCRSASLRSPPATVSPTRSCRRASTRSCIGRVNGPLHGDLHGRHADRCADSFDGSEHVGHAGPSPRWFDRCVGLVLAVVSRLLLKEEKCAGELGHRTSPTLRRAHQPAPPTRPPGENRRRSRPVTPDLLVAG